MGKEAQMVHQAVESGCRREWTGLQLLRVLSVGTLMRY